jgi:hypothetical protein
MARISVVGDRLLVEVQGLHRLWALKRRIEVPLAHVRGVFHDPGVGRERKGIRAPGLAVPRVATMGTFYRHGRRSFWDIRSGSHAVVVDLAHERWVRLVVDVDDPVATVTALEHALSAVERDPAPLPGVPPRA